jgi:hypothetical protein
MVRRTSFLGSLSALAVAGIVPIVVACNGHIGLGNTDSLQPVSTTSAVAEINGTGGKNGAIACAAGWAHPNVCCSAGPDVASACGAWEENPFRACASGSTTYPNLLSCCELSDPTKCVDTSPSGVSLPPTPPPAYGCGFACPPGWWAESGGAVPVSSVSSGGGASSGGSTSGGTLNGSGSSSGGSSGGGIGGEVGPQCCTTVGTATECVAQGYGAVPVSEPIACAGTVGYGGGSSGSSSGGTIALDAGVANPVDAATPPPEDAGIPLPTDDAGTLPGGWFDDGGCGVPEDAGSPYPPGYDGGTASLCGACPPGWSATDPDQPELCCQAISGSVTLCFSQASGPATSIGGGEDGGSSVAPTPVGSTGPSTGSSGWGSGSASSPDGGVGGPSCSGSDSSCSCEETLNGHNYALDCFATSSGSISCSCTIDGTATGAAPTVDSCQDSTAVPNAFSASTGCNFPI